MCSPLHWPLATASAAAGRSTVNTSAYRSHHGLFKYDMFNAIKHARRCQSKQRALLMLSGVAWASCADGFWCMQYCYHPGCALMQAGMPHACTPGKGCLVSAPSTPPVSSMGTLAGRARPRQMWHLPTSQGCLLLSAPCIVEQQIGISISAHSSSTVDHSLSLSEHHTTPTAAE